MIVLAHVSDIHLDGTEVRAERARRVLTYLAGLPRAVDAVLVSGDIADHGTAEEYAEARELLGGLPVPVLTCPGNHDERGAYRKVLLGREAGDGPVNEVRRVGGAVVAMCDSTVPGPSPTTCRRRSRSTSWATTTGSPRTTASCPEGCARTSA